MSNSTPALLRRRKALVQQVAKLEPLVLRGSLIKRYKRADKWRYDLAQRDSNGRLHIYYGVTEDGIHGPWRQFVKE